jgi:hypothetical protein
LWEYYRYDKFYASETEAAEFEYGAMGHCSPTAGDRFATKSWPEIWAYDATQSSFASEVSGGSVVTMVESTSSVPEAQ